MTCSDTDYDPTKNVPDTKDSLSLPPDCRDVARQMVCVQAQVTVHPSAVAGDPQIKCLGAPTAEPYTQESVNGESRFVVRQNFCVEIPLSFSVSASAQPQGVLCERPLVVPAQHAGAGPHTVRFYRKHPAVSLALLEAGGGRIVLGSVNDGSGIVVTAKDAALVLSYKTPSPPSPEMSSEYARSYQYLYALLLAAKLNCLAGADGGKASKAVERADLFLASSPAGIGMMGAESVLEPLAEFNRGGIHPNIPEN